MYHADLKGSGVPYLTILDADGKVVLNQATGPLEKGSAHDPAMVLEVLSKWVAPPVDAKAVLAQSIARAKAEKKRVFLHFGAPWCGWCHKLEDFLELPEVAPLMARAFVDLKIDTDRMTNGQDVLRQYAGPESQGIPWFAALDAEGRAVADSMGPNGNLGYPFTNSEIGEFVRFLKKAAPELSADELGTIEAALKARGEGAKQPSGNSATTVTIPAIPLIRVPSADRP
jgi:thiol-disulfide isomerase/thioredoxin